MGTGESARHHRRVLIAIGGIVFIANVLSSRKAGEKAGANPWDAGTLEWATARRPELQLREPAARSMDAIRYGRRQRNASSVTGIRNDRREVLVTSLMDAEPQSPIRAARSNLASGNRPSGHHRAGRIDVPVSWYYLGLALGNDRADWMVLAARPGGDRAMTAQRTLDVLTCLIRVSSEAPLWWGQVFLAIIEGVLFLMLIAMYFYFRLSVDVWPPPGARLGSRTLATLCLAVLFASCIGSYIASEGARKTSAGA